jgi:two-component system, OmpR family, sensor kinase
MNDTKYAIKNAFLYTLFIAIVLLTPLYLYMVYTKNVYEIKNELMLKQNARTIIHSMEEFGNRNEPTFNFPRFQLFQAGLYDNNFKPIFTLINQPMETFSPGYHKQDAYVYYIMSLPEHRYFNANYLIIGNELSYISVYQKAALILLSIVLVVFVLSLFFLRRFALPFKRVNEKLDGFIKDSMHEINTPLSIINVNIDLFNRKNPENKYLRRIKAASKTLSNIYNDMDYLIREENKKFEMESIQLDEYLRERVEYFYEIAAMKNIYIDLQITCQPTITYSIIKLQRIIDNTLSNAIKYSPESTKIVVALEKADEGCHLSFTDQGIGIAEPKMIFERYYREKSEKGGFGIGLNIVKKIIDEDGIELKVSSTVGKGSCFDYLIPSSLLDTQ